MGRPGRRVAPAGCGWERNALCRPLPLGRAAGRGRWADGKRPGVRSHGRRSQHRHCSTLWTLSEPDLPHLQTQLCFYPQGLCPPSVFFSSQNRHLYQLRIHVNSHTFHLCSPACHRILYYYCYTYAIAQHNCSYIKRQQRLRGRRGHWAARPETVIEVTTERHNIYTKRQKMTTKTRKITAKRCKLTAKRCTKWWKTTPKIRKTAREICSMTTQRCKTTTKTC